MKLVSIPANPVPDNAVAGSIKTPDGVTLRFARFAPPPGRKGTVVVLQGRAEFIEKYFETARDLRARGFAVATFDWRGQGLSERALTDRQKGYVRDFSQYATDLDAIMEQVCCRIVRRHTLLSAIRWAPPSRSGPVTAAAAGSSAWCCRRR